MATRPERNTRDQQIPKPIPLTPTGLLMEGVIASVRLLFAFLRGILRAIAIFRQHSVRLSLHGLRFQRFHFGRVLYLIGNFLLPVGTQRHFDEVIKRPMLIIRQPFWLVIQLSHVIRLVSQCSAPTILFLATEHDVICLSLFGREYRLNPPVLDTAGGLVRRARRGRTCSPTPALGPHRRYRWGMASSMVLEF